MKSSIYTLAASASTALAAVRGFNYGSSGQTQSSFESQFTVAQGLVGADDFSSARLYTMIQDATTNTVISAIPAAIATNTTLLLGLWASETQAAFDNELTALRDAISQYGSQIESLVVGISVGSEDLYRISPTGIKANEGTGQEPSVLVDYIGQVRSVLSGTALSAVPVGHVDTWNSYVNSSNAAVIDACDFIGVDAYPYYQTTYTNDISDGGSLFFSAYDQTVAAANGKPVWVTESGWPVSGPTENLAVASTANAETYWQDVACQLESRGINFWWYILVDSGASPSFGVTGGLTTTPLYDLSCSSVSSSSSSAVASKTSINSVASATMPTTAALSTTIAISNAVPTGGVGSSVASSAGSSVGSVVASISKATSAGATAKTTAAPSASVATSVSTETGDEPETITIYSTTLVTITGCNIELSTVCPASSTGSASVASASASSVLATAASSVTASAASSVTPSGTATSSGCPADISGAYQYPHLIVPVNASSPNTAYGTSYNGTVTPSVSTIFNFDIPESYAGKECSTIFLFPKLSQLETSSYSFNGKGGFTISILKGVATESTTYANAPAIAAQIGSVPALAAGNSYTLSHDSCPAGTRVSFELTSTGGLDLEFFEDYNPSPLGLYVRAC
ncbi:hypothetical protein MBLNU459_g0326t1 [Dothideomycetes sp. NU459]